ncbi:hypothetical protein REPUB_Repub09cG0032600 [Reevesia pubescens]
MGSWAAETQSKAEQTYPEEEMDEEKRNMAGHTWGRPPCCLHVKHLRHLLQRQPLFMAWILSTLAYLLMLNALFSFLLTWMFGLVIELMNIWGWKANPVEFDSVFNRSRHTFSCGTQILFQIQYFVVLCRTTLGIHILMSLKTLQLVCLQFYASFLDEWSFDQFQRLLNRSNEDPKLKRLLEKDNFVIFLHLLGCDSNGHAHRPFSSIYLNNEKVVDRIAKRVYNLLENYYQDNRHHTSSVLHS